MKLKDVVDVVINNDICVVLKVKDGQELNLISLGCFFGSESMFRLTKGRTVACTVFENSGKRYSFHWGADGHTLVTEQCAALGRIVQSCIEKDFGIVCQTH